MTTPIGSLAFLSYRGSVRDAVVPVSNWLTHDLGLVENVKFIKPDTLAREHEIMLPFECFEFMMVIWEVIEECDTFVFLHTEDYFHSLWTNLEIMGWLFLAESPVAIRIAVDANGDWMSEGVQWEAMSEEERPMWSQIRSHLSPGAMMRHRTAPYRGGQYSTKHYLLPCRVCGEYSLLPKKLVESRAKHQEEVRCAHSRCRAVHVVKHEGAYNRMRYRVPIVAVPRSHQRAASLRPLGADEILQLYADRKTPPPLIAVGED